MESRLLMMMLDVECVCVCVQVHTFSGPLLTCCYFQVWSFASERAVRAEGEGLGLASWLFHQLLYMTSLRLLSHPMWGVPEAGEVTWLVHAVWTGKEQALELDISEF